MEQKDYSKILRSVEHKTYLEKFDLWIRLLSEIQHEDIGVKSNIYNEFLKIFPFNHDYWNSQAQMHAENSNNDEAILVYEKGLNMNPRSVNLWNIFCIWVEYNFNEDEQFVRNCFEKAISFIGIDYFSKLIWQKYIEFEHKKNNIINVNQIYWRLVDIPIQDLTSFIMLYKEFIINQTDIELVKGFYDTAKAEFNSENLAEVDELEVKESLISLYEKKAIKASTIASKKAVYENKLKMNDFDGKPIHQDEISNWIKYIKAEKLANEGRPGNIIYIFEKAITHICHNKEIWMTYINYLKDELNDEDFLLSKLKKYRIQFKNFFFEPIFEECDIEECRGNIKETQSIYKELKDDYPNDPIILRKVFQFYRRNQMNSECENLVIELLENTEATEESKIFQLKEYLDTKQQFKFQLTKDPNYFLERFVRNSSFNITILTIIFDYLLKQDKEDGQNKVSLILDRFLIKCRSDGDGEMFKKATKLYSTIVRNNCYDISTILNIDKASKQKVFSNVNSNWELEPIWNVESSVEAEEKIRKIAEEFNKKTSNVNIEA